MKVIFIFNVYNYTNDFDYLVKTKKQVKIIRTNFESAYNYLILKYPVSKGYFLELQNSYILDTYQKRRKSWFEYLAK